MPPHHGLRSVGPFIALAALLGCTMPRQAAPAWTGVSHASLDETSVCIVKSLDAVVPTFTGPYTHHIQTIEPGRVVEVESQQKGLNNIMEGIYFVRITALSKTSATIELHAAPAWTPNLIPALAACGAQV